MPALVLTARDDPFIAVDPFEELTPPPAVEIHMLPCGGHLGFVGWDGAGSIRWGERRFIDWLNCPDRLPTGAPHEVATALVEP